MQDVFLGSSFGLWAVLLGLSPVLAFRLLMGGWSHQALTWFNPW